MITIKERNGLTINTPDQGEKTLFLDTDSKLKTKDENGVIEEVAVVSANRPKVYKALLTQSGTDAPVATVLENTLGEEIVWSRQTAGVYLGIAPAGSDFFNSGKFIGYAYSGIDDEASIANFLVTTGGYINEILLVQPNSLDNHVYIRLIIEVYP